MANATPEQASAFAGALINQETLLSSALEFINDNMSPEDVFDAEKLAEWAQMRGYEKPTD